MKRWAKILLTVLAVLVVVATAVMVWQRNNISVVLTTITKTGDEIANELDDSKEKLKSEIKEKYNADLVSDFTAEEESKIIKGEISAEDAVKILEKKYEDTKKENASAQNKRETVDKLIGDKAIELYSLKAYYLGKLGQIEAKVKKEYIAMPKEKKNLVGKQELVAKYIGTATSLLNQCDNEVNKLLKELESELKALKEDTSVVKTIRDAYEKEKALKKAYYLKLLGD